MYVIPELGPLVLKLLKKNLSSAAVHSRCVRSPVKKLIWWKSCKIYEDVNKRGKIEMKDDISEFN